MKEFDKWVAKQKYRSPNYYLGAEEAWIAALEWALRQKWLRALDEENEGLNWGEVTDEAIIKELGDK